MMQAHISLVFLAVDAVPDHLHTRFMKHTIPSLAYPSLQVRVDMLTLCIGEYVSDQSCVHGVASDEAPLKVGKPHMSREYSARATAHRKNRLASILSDLISATSYDR
jgi:hypothetical protein